MKRNGFLVALLTAASFAAFGQTDTAQPRRQTGFGRILEQVTKSTSSGAVTSSEIASGLKEALRIGINKGADKASAVDGYYKNPLIKIIMPPEAQQVEKRLRQVGLGKQVDSFIMELNRSAEDAAKEAKPIFLTALTQMTIQDAVGILRGEPNAATQYLKRTTTSQLVTAFTPVIEKALKKNNASQHYADIVNTYNRLPFVAKKADPDITRYATTRAVDGMFTLIEQEEREIRKNPAARVNDLLRRVFGS